MDVAWVVNQRAGGKLPQFEPAVAAGDGQGVLGQPPAGVKRQAVAADFFAAQQGFKAGERGHGVHFVGVLQAGEDVGFGCGLVGVAGGVFGGDAADAVAADDVGMWFVDDVGVGVVFAHGFEQVEVAADLRRAVADGGVVFDLARNEDDGFVGFWHAEICAADVVFADFVCCEHLLQQGGRLKILLVESLVLQDVFEAGGRFGVEVDAHVVDDERERRHEVGAEADRADEAVFHAQQGDVVLSGEADDFVFAAAPCQQAGVGRQSLGGEFVRRFDEFQTA